MNNSQLIPIAVVAVLIGYRLFKRARGLMTRQKVNPGPMTTRLVLFGIVGVLLLGVTLAHPLSMLGDVVGLAAGGVLAWYGLQLTSFDRLPDGLYYTPNKYLGLGVFALFLLRLVYKIGVVVVTSSKIAHAGGGHAAAGQYAMYGSDPLSSAIYFLLIGYYVFYYGALLLRYREMDRPQAA